MRIFHTCVSLPEGNIRITVDNVKIKYKGIETTILYMAKKMPLTNENLGMEPTMLGIEWESLGFHEGLLIEIRRGCLQPTTRNRM